MAEMADLLRFVNFCGLTQHDLTWCVKVQEEEEVEGVGGSTHTLVASVDSQPLTLQGVSMVMVVIIEDEWCLW